MVNHMAELKTLTIVVGLIVSFWSDEFTTAACAIIGAVIATLYNYDFILDNKRVGWSVAAGAGLFPVLVTQAIMSWMAIADFKIGNLIGLVTGLIAFGFVRFILENQTGIVQRIVDLIFKKKGETKK